MTVSLEMMAFNADSRPRQMVYSKMERLISLMNDQKTGIPLKDKKTSPASFTGYDYINWLSENVCAKDTAEAMHLGTFLCLYGYIYPADLKSFSVKDDKSVLYRHQSPHNWPSKNLKLTNEKYIIYLLKRSKRNKKKHGLEEYEQTALGKLQLLFCDKIGFCTEQALEQVGQVKQMKRVDKFVSDLQERAFWKVHRPPPSQTRHVEEGPSRCFPPSQMMARKRNNKELKIKEVGYLRRAMKRPRMKFSESLKIMLKRVEQYLEFDPLLDNNNSISNPWISDDETIWEINRDDIEVPFLMRIKKWGLSFEELLHDSRGRNEFEMFLMKEYSQENLLFYQACKQLISCPISQVIQWKEKIESKSLVNEFEMFLMKEYSQENLLFYQACKQLISCPISQVIQWKEKNESEYLTAGAQREVNIDCKTLEVVITNLKSGTSLNNRYVFQPAMEHVYALMKKDSYSRFFRSDQYKDLLELAQNHYSKKRFLSFGSNKKKNTVTSSPQPRRRGSASSDNVLGGDGDMAGSSYHSYSTGNLRELDEKPKNSLRQSNSPSLRRRTDEIDKNANKEARRRSNLDVPRSSGYGSGVSDSNRKSEAMSQCLAINVPKSNVVAPWDGDS